MIFKLFSFHEQKSWVFLIPFPFFLVRKDWSAIECWIVVIIDDYSTHETPGWTHDQVM
jgi:hypothetical protein